MRAKIRQGYTMTSQASQGHENPKMFALPAHPSQRIVMRENSSHKNYCGWAHPGN
jgi:hypothetical protein